MFVHLGRLFLKSLPGVCFLNFCVFVRCHFRLTFCSQSGSWIDFGGTDNLMQNRMAGVSNEFYKGGGTSNNLWFGAVLGHGAPWSLVIGKDARGSGWQLVASALEARWRIWIISRSGSVQISEHTVDFLQILLSTTWQYLSKHWKLKRWELGRKLTVLRLESNAEKPQKMNSENWRCLVK